MPFYLFTEEDENGRLGYSGKEFYSEVGAESAAEDYPGITHIKEGKTLVEAKRKLREELVKKKKDMGILYKNIRRT